MEERTMLEILEGPLGLVILTASCVGCAIGAIWMYNKYVRKNKDADKA